MVTTSAIALYSNNDVIRETNSLLQLKIALSLVMSLLFISVTGTGRGR